MTEPEAAGQTPPSVFTPAAGLLPTPSPPADALPLILTLGLALLAYLLVQETDTLGLNVLLLALALTGTLVLTLRLRRTSVRPEALALFGLGLLCALGVAVRDGLLMGGLNLLGLFTALGLGAAYLRFPGLTRLSVGGVLGSALWAWVRGFSGLPASALRFPWARLKGVRNLGRGLPTAQSRRVLVGVLLTLPLLLVFGWLLGGADAGFGALTARLFQWRLPDWDLNALAFALLQITFWAFLLGGPVYAALLAGRAVPTIQTGPDQKPEASAGPHSAGLGLTELGIPLLSTSLLFCVYLGVQAERYFGQGLLGGLTYSEYVRRGFGELTAVAALTLVVLLVAHTLLRRGLRQTLAYRLMSAAVLLPLSLLIVSAYTRLALYVGAYGLSEIRVLGGVFLAWVALSLLAYAALLWRNGLERFAYFSLISGLGLIVTLDGVNPGRLIASVNLTRALSAGETGEERRATFAALADLGADSVPVAAARLDSGPLRADELCTLARFLPSYQPDWRVWNLARSRAAALVEELRRSNSLPDWNACRYSEDDGVFR
ncbi:DUF4153 domain-containing protein [Deinococcus altitudinis]|uniref:DUF4153 domain-containing protein n=1 Tax=Deinococcus altitudinis TaxID=468914 RepID=UPI003891AC8F